MNYRGRIAPSPTGYLHLGHGATFRTAWERARAANGTLILRVEDLDADRCRDDYRNGISEDLEWFGLDWDESPELGGPSGPYIQSRRMPLYRSAWETLRRVGAIYPCRCSRQDIRNALGAPHQGDEEPLYPGTCRPEPGTIPEATGPTGVNWRFRVPHGEEIVFSDRRVGEQRAVCGVDFGDFLVWRRDDVPAYQLAVVVDDHAMGITEVVRGEDLLTSTFRQLLLYRALGAASPAFFHCRLLCDESGRRLAKRHAALSLRALRDSGRNPDQLRCTLDAERVLPAL